MPLPTGKVQLCCPNQTVTNRRVAAGPPAAAVRHTDRSGVGRPQAGPTTGQTPRWNRWWFEGSHVGMFQPPEPPGTAAGGFPSLARAVAP